MKDELLEQILALIEDPIPLLNSPEDERYAMECALFDLAQILECRRHGLPINVSEGKDMPRTSATLNKSNTCRCSVCGEYFSTLSNFDKHRKGDHGSKVCVDPESVGLVIGNRGTGSVWKMPGFEAEVSDGKENEG